MIDDEEGGEDNPGDGGENPPGNGTNPTPPPNPCKWGLNGLCREKQNLLRIKEKLSSLETYFISYDRSVELLKLNFFGCRLQVFSFK